MGSDGLAMGGLAAAVDGCVGCVGWRQLCFDFGGFFFFFFLGGCGHKNFSGCGFFFFLIYKLVLVDVGLCRWWLSALLQPRWLCRCC